MNKLKKILYGFRLKNVEKNLVKNLNKIEAYIKNNSPSFNDILGYKGNYNEHLRLMVCKSYLENKLACVAN